MRYLFIVFMFILVSGKGQTILPAYQENIRILPSQLLSGGATNGQILIFNAVSGKTITTTISSIEIIN